MASSNMRDWLKNEELYIREDSEDDTDDKMRIFITILTPNIIVFKISIK